MPTILPPDEHLTAGLSAVQKHIDYHEGELAALRGLRRQYRDALGVVAADRVHVEATPAEPIRVFSQNTGESMKDAVERLAAASKVEPSFDEVVSTMSGRVPVQ